VFCNRSTSPESINSSVQHTTEVTNSLRFDKKPALRANPLNSPVPVRSPPPCPRRSRDPPSSAHLTYKKNDPAVPFLSLVCRYSVSLASTVRGSDATPPSKKMLLFPVSPKFPQPILVCYPTIICLIGVCPTGFQSLCGVPFFLIFPLSL